VVLVVLVAVGDKLQQEQVLLGRDLLVVQVHQAGQITEAVVVAALGLLVLLALEAQAVAVGQARQVLLTELASFMLVVAVVAHIQVVELLVLA
jgi:hypothetical protein